MMRLRLCLLVALLVGALSAIGGGAQEASALQPNPLGLGLQPVLGWSSWSGLRQNPSLAQVELEASAMVSSGLKAAGYMYINLDDFYYQCPSSAGPNVDQWGRWVTDPTKFPPSGSTDGIQVLANYVHSLGLKFGIYLTSGISKQAVALNTPVEGGSNGVLSGQPSGYTADQIATTSAAENYNCGGMVRLNYSSPGTQLYVNSIVDRFASWGVDFIKYDGMEDYSGPDLQVMQNAIAQSGRPMLLDATEGDYTIALAPAVTQFATQNEFSPDVETGGGATAYTRYANIGIRFNTVAQWQPYAGPGNFEDLDSVEVGNGSSPGIGGREDGLTVNGRKTALSLWSLDSSPLILGPDLTNLDPVDLALLLNPSVLAVDQDGTSAARIGGGPYTNASQYQVISKLEPSGNGVVGLFNTDSVKPHIVSTTTSAMGLGAATGYLLTDLWSGQASESGPVISGSAGPQGVALYRVTPVQSATQAPPNATVNVTGLGTLTPGQPVTATETFTDNGVVPALNAQLSLSAPSGWTVTPTTATSFGQVASGQTVSASFSVVAAGPTTTSTTVTGSAGYGWSGGTPQSVSVAEPVTVALPIEVNEVRLGVTGATTNQFVELYNAGSAPVNIGGWTVVYESGTATAYTTVATIPTGTTIAAGGYYLLGRSGGYTGTPAANQTFTTALSASGGGVGITDSSGALVDSVGWGSAANGLVQDCPAPAPATTAAPGTSIARISNGADTASNCTDFQTSTDPTPGAQNALGASNAMTTATLSPAPDGGYYNQNPTVTLSATDPGGPGILTTEIQIDNLGYNTYNPANPPKITGDGTHTLQYYSIDDNGVSEVAHTMTVQIDTTPPTTGGSVSPAPVNGVVNGPATLTLTPTDAGSGVAETFYQINGGPWQLAAVLGRPIVIAAGGAQTVNYYSIDVAGNIEATHTLSFSINPQVNETYAASVAAQLSLSINGTPTLGNWAFLAGQAGTYATSTSATVTSTATSTALTVADTSTNVPGHLVNGIYSLPQALQMNAVDASNPSPVWQSLGATPTTLLTYTAPVSADAVTINAQQSIAATDALHTGTYSKTFVFTVSVLTP